MLGQSQRTLILVLPSINIVMTILLTIKIKFPQKIVFSDKEFLHITTPKPINPANQRGSSSKLFNNQGDIMYPWAESLSIIPRGRLIDAAAQILNPYSQATHYPDPIFQACITPSSYPSSSIGIDIQDKTIEDSPVAVHQCRSEEKVHRIPSKPSVPRIGPFI